MTRCTCRVSNVLKSGWLSKLPPQEKIKRGFHNAKDRWCTLGKIEVCTDCSGGNKLLEERRPFLMLSYYKDGEEKEVRGRLNVEGCEVEQVNEVEENPKKFQKEKYILKLHLQSNRILYVFAKNEQDLNGWLNGLKKHIKNAEEIDEVILSNKEEEEEEEEDKDLFCISPTRRSKKSEKLEMQLTLLRDIRNQHPDFDISPLSEEDKVATLLGPSDMDSGDSNTLTARLSRISQASSNRTSGFCSIRSDSDASTFDNKRISNMSVVSGTSCSSRDSALSSPYTSDDCS